jgi:hypothetical protein
MSAANDLVSARASIDALRASIEDTVTTTAGGHALRVLDITSDCLDLVEDVLGLGDPGEPCPDRVHVLEGKPSPTTPPRRLATHRRHAGQDPSR